MGARFNMKYYLHQQNSILAKSQTPNSTCEAGLNSNRMSTSTGIQCPWLGFRCRLYVIPTCHADAISIVAVTFISVSHPADNASRISIYIYVNMFAFTSPHIYICIKLFFRGLSYVYVCAPVATHWTHWIHYIYEECQCLFLAVRSSRIRQPFNRCCCLFYRRSSWSFLAHVLNNKCIEINRFVVNSLNLKTEDFQ